LTGTSAANSTVKVFDGTAQIGSATATSSGAWTFTSAALTDGNHNFIATATSSGTTSAASSALSVKVDTVAPGASALNPGKKALVSARHCGQGPPCPDPGLRSLKTAGTPEPACSLTLFITTVATTPAT